MEHRLRVGIAGYGVVGRRRRHFIDLHARLSLAALSDITFECDGIAEDGIPVFRDYREMIERTSLDVLFVCLPNDVAPDATIRGLLRGTHVFCEKPPGRNVADILRVREVEASRPNLKLKYGFNHRYHDSVRDALTIVQSGQFGKVINIRGVYGKSAMIPWPNDGTGHHWRSDRNIAGGGILLDQGIHMVDLMRCFAGEFDEVKSYVSNGHWGLDVEDNAYALMRARNGVVAMLHSTATQWRHKFALEVALAKGALVLEGILSGTKSYGRETLTVLYADERSSGSPRESTSTYIDDNSWRDEINEMVTAIMNNEQIEVGSSLDALRTMQLVYQIYYCDPEWRARYGIKIE